MVVAVGVDVVSIERMQRALERTPALRARVFGHWDIDGLSGPREAESLAARFAAKEATVKALGGGIAGFSWHDIQVRRSPQSPPQLVVTGGAAEASKALGITSWHLSLSHDAGVAVAFVVAESTTGSSQ